MTLNLRELAPVDDEAIKRQGSSNAGRTKDVPDSENPFLPGVVSEGGWLLDTLTSGQAKSVRVPNDDAKQIGYLAGKAGETLNVGVKVRYAGTNDQRLAWMKLDEAVGYQWAQPTGEKNADGEDLYIPYRGKSVKVTWQAKATRKQNRKGAVSEVAPE